MKKALTAAVVVAIFAAASTSPSQAQLIDEKGCPTYSNDRSYWANIYLSVLAAFGISPGIHIQDYCLDRG